MSIKIRLSRGGRKNLPFYSIVATNSTSPRDSKFLEKIGTFNPLLKADDEKRIVLNKNRAEYWLSVGAIPSERVANFLIAIGVKGAEKHKPRFTPKAKGTGAKKKALEAMEKAQKALEEAKAQEAKAQEAELSSQEAELSSQEVKAEEAELSTATTEA